MTGLIGRKIGMTSVFDETGKQIACTVIEAGPCVVTQVKTKDIDGYEAIQLAFGDKKEKNTSRPLIGHFEKASTTPKRKVIEFRGSNSDLKIGDIVSTEFLNVGDKISATGTSKGKGFQGAIKRHGFSGSNSSHGQKSRERTLGSIGACATPGRVIKGKKMPGRMGNDRVKQINLKVMSVLHDKNLIFVKGCVPGHNGSFIVIEK